MGRALAFIVTIALAACASQSKSSILPPGTYRYESREAGVTLRSTVTVDRDASGPIVREDATFENGFTTNVESRLDPKTYSVVTYSVRNDPEGENTSIRISPSGEELKDSKTTTVAKAPSPSAPSWVFGNWASCFTAIPAFVHLTGAKTVNAYLPGTLHGKALALLLRVTTTTAPAPAGVPSADASLSLTWPDERRAAVSLWYDPASFVVDAVSFNGSTSFLRKQ